MNVPTERSNRFATLSFGAQLAMAAVGKKLPQTWTGIYHRRKYTKRIRKNWTPELLELPRLPLDIPISFMVAGAQKAGTSALIRLLEQHPKVSLPVVKEPHFFNNLGFFQSKSIPVEAYHAAFPFRGSQMLYGEGTPRTMFSPSCVERVSKYNPQMKLICILRDPVSRAFSAWNMNHIRGEFRSFERLINIEMDLITRSGPAHQGFINYLSRGLYANQIVQLRNHFPEAQLKFIEYDDFKTRNERVLNECLEFLGLTPCQIKTSVGKVNTYQYRDTIHPTIEKKLRDWFLPEINRIEELLEWDLSQWKVSSRNK